MMSRRSATPPLLLATLTALATVACNKVPLLAPSGSTIIVTTTATALPINGSADIIAQILEAAGTPPQDGTLVTFITTLGTVQPSEAETSGGRVKVKFIAGTTSGTATIIATSGASKAAAEADGAVPASDRVKIAIGAAAVGSVSLVASPGTIPSTGGSSTITATVVDTGGGTLSAVPVSFSTDVGSVSPSVVATDASGKAQATLTTARTAKVTASAGVPVGTAAAPSDEVTVTVNVTQTITITTVAPTSPTAGQAVTLTLAYAGAGASPTTRVSVNWGDGAVSNFSGQPGAVSHSYSAAGSYVAQVTGTDSAGETSTTSASIVVAPVTVSLASSANPSVAGAPVTFTATPSTGAQVDHYEWTFSDANGAGNRSTSGATTSHVYAEAGTYEVTVTMVTTTGSRRSSSIEQRVN